MAACGHQAVLVITKTVDGTSTSVARKRVELTCTLEKGHDGAHRDQTHGETWEGRPSQRPTVLRHEDE
ncbi:MAG TPA: hypothetical protein VHE30_09755 [Polyangiaceae bacterium]|nr:hypothetical protein [Polyangiaceae bacterium]